MVNRFFFGGDFFRPTQRARNSQTSLSCLLKSRVFFLVSSRFCLLVFDVIDISRRVTSSPSFFPPWTSVEPSTLFEFSLFRLFGELSLQFSPLRASLDLVTTGQQPLDRDQSRLLLLLPIFAVNLVEGLVRHTSRRTFPQVRSSRLLLLPNFAVVLVEGLVSSHLCVPDQSREHAVYPSGADLLKQGSN